MMRHHLISLTLSLLLLAVTVGSSRAQETTLWVSPLTAFDPQELLTIERGQPSVAARIRTSSPGSFIVQIPLFIPSNRVVKSIELCYELSNTASYIDRMILGQVTVPGTLSNRLQDDTDLDSSTPSCHVTTTTTIPNPYSPIGSTLLQLTVVFASSSDFIEIGAIGVNTEPAP